MKREILKRALKGDDFKDLHIIDAHCHMGPHYNYYFPRAEIEEMIEDANRVGIEKMCIAPHLALTCDYKEGNRKVAEAGARYPDMVWGLLVLNPNKPGEISQEFINHYSNPLFIGVKIHPGMHRHNILSDSYFAIYDKVREYGGFILSHTWETSYCSIDQCENVIREYPEIPFIMGHSGGTGEGVQKAIRIANKYENAYMDTSGFEFSDTWIEDIMAKVDKTKVLFGSDVPFHDIRGGISRILFADLDDDLKLAILRNNFLNMVQKSPKRM